MLIEIKKSVVTEALKRRGQTQNEPLDLLFQMAICAKKGYHVVWVPSLESDKSLREELSALITKANVNALCFAEERHRLDVGWLTKNASLRTILSYEKEPKTKDIVINPSRDPSFQPYSELFLLVENITDADFYRILLSVYRKKNKLSSYECCYYPVMGGGVTIAVVMKNEIILRQHYCFAIVDSDKHSPKGPKGQTSEQLKAALTGAPDYCRIYRMDEVMEIENLIPHRVVRLLFPLQTGDIDIFAKDASYFDMKFGLRLTSLENEHDNTYWKGILPEKASCFRLRDSLRKANPKKDPFIAALKTNDTEILCGFGGSLLKRVLNKNMDANSHEMSLNIQAYNLLIQTDYSHLSLSQQKEWDNIGKELFSWSCGMKAT